MLEYKLRGINMKTIGIIAEFNPFHSGHKYLIEKAKKITNANNAIIICSGNYVQRGTPAIFDKTLRAKASILNGADVVFELPVIYSTASAETFARASVKFLDLLGCVDYLCFGIETDNIKALPTLAKILTNEPEDYKNMLSMYLKNGFSYPKARSKALSDYCSENNILNSLQVSQIIDQPNNILAIEYLKSLRVFNSKIKPVAIKRQGAGYNSNDLGRGFASASGIRNEIINNKPIGNYIPDNCLNLYSDSEYLSTEDFSEILGYKLITEKKFDKYYGISKDLSNRINNYKSDFTGISDFIKDLQSKNYTYAGISRALLHIILDIKTEDVEEFIDDNYMKYGRLLAFNNRSSILSSIKENSSIEIVSKFSTYYNQAQGLTKKMLDIDLKADNLYRMIYMTKYNKSIPDEFKRQIYIL